MSSCHLSFSPGWTNSSFGWTNSSSSFKRTCPLVLYSKDISDSDGGWIQKSIIRTSHSSESLISSHKFQKLIVWMRHNFFFSFFFSFFPAQLCVLFLRLQEKAVLFSSHVWFLKKCLKFSLTPKFIQCRFKISWALKQQLIQRSRYLNAQISKKKKNFYLASGTWKNSEPFPYII